MSSATEEISAACSPFHLVLWRETFYSCCPFEFAEWQSLCSVISKEKRRGCSSLVAYKTNKHVQSDNSGVKCVTFVSETITRYGSNIMKVWQEIFTPMTLAFSCEVVHKKLWKSVNICKSYSKKISGTFFIWTWCITQISRSWLFSVV